ncbi:pancreatic hormone-like [Alligator sinensis]|uniref:Pancreatic hormone-like n=1 Tax=Alligator sinensis TaxID=38654 RepID=A0A3Q0FZF2_ALLSI|nr:pancreatic hormone-like [Alligator sinensis]
MASRGRWDTLFALTCCMAVLIGHAANATPLQPKYPGDGAPVEDLIQFYNDLQQYLNVVTRPRFGKRSGSQALCGDPYRLTGC